MRPGTVVMERYTVDGLAGTGGMGSVYRARDRDGTAVALKVLETGRSALESRFTREARMLVELAHPAIVRCLDSGVTRSGEHFLAMEWLDGHDLGTALRANQLGLDDALALVGRVAGALGFAHRRGMIHRDVKPSNIFLPSDDISQAKLLDFGVARWSSATSLTSTGTQVGTPSYMAPEQIRGEDEIDPAVDIFALGCVLYQCLTGELAFPGQHPMAVFYKVLCEDTPDITQVVSGLPEPVIELLGRMIAKDPAERPSDGETLAAEVEAVRQMLASAGPMPSVANIVSDADAITSQERQLLSIVLILARVPGSDEPAESRELEGWNRVTEVFTSPAGTGEIDYVTKLRLRYESFGVHFDSLGDGSLLAILDSRRTATDQAVDAARCALDLRSVFAHAPIAVATGRATLGKRLLLGEIIDRAASLLEPSETPIADRRQLSTQAIFVDETTAGLLGNRFAIEPRGRGGSLLGYAQLATHTVLGKPTPLVGRRREMATMVATFEECLEEREARVILVTGRAGAGKSRLHRELLQQLIRSRHQMQIWGAGGDAMRTGSPLDLMAQVIRYAADIRAGESLTIRQRSLASRVAASVPERDRVRVTAFLGELVDTQWPTDYEPLLREARVTPRVMGDQIRRALLHFMAAEIQRQPMLLLLDDLHWADRGTVEFLDHALAELAGWPLCVLGLGRPETLHRFPDMWAHHDRVDLRLRPLSTRAARQLVEAVLGAEVEPARVELLIERAAGHALYLEELIRHAAAGRWELPPTVLAMMQSRLEELLPRPRRVLRAASIFGESFFRDGVAAILGDDRGLDEHLRTLCASELLEVVSKSQFPDRECYRFRHDLVREAAHDLLTAKDRRVGHKLAAAWLIQVGETDARIIAEHFERGHELAQALPYFVQAAEHACAGGDFAAALALAGRARDCSASGKNLAAVAVVETEAHLWSQELEQTVESGLLALSLLPEGERAWYEAAERVCEAQYRLGQVEALVARAKESSSGPPIEHALPGWLILTASLAHFLQSQGQQRAALPLQMAVDQQVRTLESDLMTLRNRDLAQTIPAVAARVHAMRATRGLVADGNPATFLREIERSANCYTRAGDVCRACEARIRTGYAQLELGLYAQARDTLSAALEVAESLSLDNLVDHARQNLALALAYTGEAAQAESLARMSARGFERRGNQRLATASRIYLAIVHLLLGEGHRAEHEAERAVQASPPRAPMQIYAKAISAWVLLARYVMAPDYLDKTFSDDLTIDDGAVANIAMSQATEAMKLMSEIGGVEAGEALVRLTYAEAQYEFGDEDEAYEVICEARARLLTRAENIDRDDWRESFLHNIPEHARTLLMYRLWTEER